MADLIVAGNMLDSAISALPLRAHGSPAGVGESSGEKRALCDGGTTPPHKRKKVHKWGRKNPTKAKRKIRRRRREVFKPEAPFNSTQFLMDEHDKLNDSDFGRRPRRRDSSISDSVEDDATECSPEDEEEVERFMVSQFWSAFQDFNAGRLDAMNRPQLLHELFSLEERLARMESELSSARLKDEGRLRPEEAAEEVSPGEVAVDAETATKIDVFRAEIAKLDEENCALRSDNVVLRRRATATEKRRRHSSSDSEDSIILSEGGELEICGGPFRGYEAPDSGVASGEGAVFSSSDEARKDAAAAAGVWEESVTSSAH